MDARISCDNSDEINVKAKSSGKRVAKYIPQA
jgi:hypothetical protein